MSKVARDLGGLQQWGIHVVASCSPPVFEALPISLVARGRGDLERRSPRRVSSYFEGVTRCVIGRVVLLERMRHHVCVDTTARAGLSTTVFIYRIQIPFLRASCRVSVVRIPPKFRGTRYSFDLHPCSTATSSERRSSAGGS